MVLVRDEEAVACVYECPCLNDLMKEYLGIERLTAEARDLANKYRTHLVRLDQFQHLLEPGPSVGGPTRQTEVMVEDENVLVRIPPMQRDLLEGPLIGGRSDVLANLVR